MGFVVGTPRSGMDKPVETMTFGPVQVAFDDTVLRPRPWTLAQSEWAAALSPELPAGPILELGCGAGHIGLAAAALTRRPLVQVDCSEAACDWARRNAAHAHLTQTVEIRHGRFGEQLHSGETFPLVIADPPYVPTEDV